MSDPKALAAFLAAESVRLHSAFSGEEARDASLYMIDALMTQLGVERGPAEAMRLVRLLVLRRDVEQ